MKFYAHGNAFLMIFLPPGSDWRLSVPSTRPDQAAPRPERADRAVPTRALHLRLPQGPRDSRDPQETGLHHRRRREADREGEGTAEDVPGGAVSPTADDPAALQLVRDDIV